MTTPAVLAVVTLELVAACVIALQAVLHINRMSRDTRLCVFGGWVVLGGSAASVVAGVLAGKTHPDLYSAAVMLGVALVLIADRRRG